MKKLHNEQGVAPVLVVGLIAVVLAVAGVGYYVMSQNSNEDATESSPAPVSTNVQPPTQDQEPVSLSGTFKNIGQKTGSGSVTLTKNADGKYVVKLGSDFKVQKGPDLFVSFGDNNTYAEGTAFAELKSLTGAQEYEVPSNIKVDDYSQVMIWCREFDTPFAAATLE